MPIEHKNSQLNDELLFLIACCQKDPSENDVNFILSYLNADDLEPNALIRLANQHGVLPLVYKTLKNLQPVILGSIGDPQSQSDSLNSSHNTSHITRSTLEHLLTDLKSAYSQIARRNMLMSAELIRIMKLLEKNNIDALAFKGPALAQMAYGDITLRQYSDLDILVDEKVIVKAGSVLSKHGYEAAFPIKILENKTCLESTNDLSFYNQSNGLLIELHWKLFREKIGRHLSFKQMSEDTQIIKINGKSLSTLSSEMLLAYLCLHGSKHAWERIEWICDIDRLIRAEKDLDWDKVINISKDMDTHITLQLGLVLSHTLFHTPLPQSIASSIQTECIKTLESKTYKLLNGPLAENEGYAKYSAIHMYQMDLLDTKFKKIQHLFATYFGISRNDCQEFPLPPSLKFLYIFIKPFRVIWKYLRYRK